jgi:hypothetical protein
MLSSKKLTCIGTLRQLFVTVFRLEIQSVMLIFSTRFVNCCPSHLPCVKEYIYCTLYTYTVQCTVSKGEGGTGVGPQQINTCSKVPLHVNIFRWRHLFGSQRNKKRLNSRYLASYLVYESEGGVRV